MKVFQHIKELHTSGGLTVTDITEEVNEAVHESETELAVCDGEVRPVGTEGGVVSPPPPPPVTWIAETVP